MLEVVREILMKKLGTDEFVLTQPEVSGRGHVATNAAFVLAGKEGKSPMEAANELKNQLEDEAPRGFFENIEIAEPGFINIKFSKETIQGEFKRISKASEKWDELKEKGKVIVEYSQPNIAKPMHVGHLRSTIIGDAIANILEFAGKRVVRWNYLGDWGTQFGKLIVAYKKWGDDKKIEKDPVNELNLLYVKFHEEAEKDPKLDDEARKEFKKLEEGDKENRELWEKFRKESIKEFEDVYKIFGIEFDEWKGESFYEKDLKPLIKKLEKKGIATESEGALIVSFDDAQDKDSDKELPPGLIRKSDGATLYLTRDIASLEHRIKKYKPDAVLYVVDNGQSLHFQQLFAIARRLGWSVDAEHIKFGLVLSEDMKRLSTRAGRHISLADVVDEAVTRARKIVDEKQPVRRAQGAPDMDEKERQRIAEVVGVGALKYNDLSQNRQSDIAFDWDKMLSLQGNSGPYLQYSYTRLVSILENAGSVGRLKEEALTSDADLALVLKLAEFPEVIRTVAENYFPHYLANYLHDLAREVNSFYESEPVLKAEGDLRDARLNLVKASANVLKTGLGLLGIEVVEKM